MRLSTRFVVCLAALIPLLVLLVGVLVVGLVSTDLRAERDRQLSARLSALTPMADSYAWRIRVAPRIRPDFLAQRLTGAALGADSPGGVAVDVPGAGSLVIGDVPAGRPTPDPAGAATFAEGERRWRFASAGLGPTGNLARVWVFEPEERIERQIALLRRRLLLVTLIAAVVGIAAGLALGRFAVRPLAVLRRQAREIGWSAPGTARLATASNVTEIDELAALLNDLLDRRDAAVTRTGEALETARAFAATVAHELRTPLTSMGTNLDLLRHPGLEPPDSAEIIADLAAEHGRIQRLITMLRRLARGELVETAAFADTDLTDIVATAAEEARRRHPRVTITFAGTGEVGVRGWAEGLRMIADNLLDNAAIHGADETGHAEITVTLSVSDPGDDPVGTARDGVEGDAGDRARGDVGDRAGDGMDGTSGCRRDAGDGVRGTVRGETRDGPRNRGRSDARRETWGAGGGEMTDMRVLGPGGTGRRARGRVVVLAVRDRGRGIPPAERELVFDRFHRGSAGAGSASSAGSGLGLTLVRQQAALHGGEAEVIDPGDGPGTRVEVRLPAAGHQQGDPNGLGRRPAGVRTWLTAPRR